MRGIQKNSVFGIIYKITNTVNGKVYIGQTTMSLRQRWRLHYSKSSTCKYIHEAINEYGSENFTIEEIDQGNSREELNEKEKYWIKEYNSLLPNGYNCDKGGYLITYTEESRKKMSAHRPDYRGHKNPRYGVKASEETRRLISEALKGKYMGENAIFRKPVINLDTGEKFPTATMAAEKYGVTVSTLTKTCRGVQKRTAGFRWAYIEEVMPNVN